MTERIRHTPVDAVLMGGRDPDKQGLGSQYKFLLEMGEGGDILERTLEAFDNSELVERVFFVGPVELIKERVTGRKKEYVLIEETKSFWGNLSTAIERQQQLGGESEVLITYSDLPFLRAESLDWLVTACNPVESVHIPVVSRNNVQRLSPTYETYYWPMREFPFKWADNLLFIDINKLSNERVSQLVEEYRNSGAGYFIFTPLKRLNLLSKYGGVEAVYTVLLNYASKFLQMRCGFQKNIPFSKLRGKGDYERLTSKILGVEAEMLKTPSLDVVLDVDNYLRLGIFRRGYKDILSIIEGSEEKEPTQR